MKHNFMNKRNGKIASVLVMYLDDEGHMQTDGYDKVEDLLEDYAAYEQAKPEPLIEDEKIRKAVRAWAGAIGEKDNLVLSKNMEYHDCCIYDGGLGKTALIDFGVDLDIEENDYTLAELCGEEEE